MGVVCNWESKVAAAEAFRHKTVATAGIQRRKEDEGQRMNKLYSYNNEDEDDEGMNLICVTSGVSYLGLALVNQLLLRGYSVRVIVHNQEEIEKVREMEKCGEMKRRRKSKLEIRMVKLSDNNVHSLEKALEGCNTLFHTSSFIDPSALSGYTKSMAEIEVRVSENVIEACTRTTSIKKCVFTSSLLACIWQDNTQSNLNLVINHTSWSNESLCIHNKLWYALGKMRAEKSAWRIANEKGLKLTSICPALITGPQFCHKNPTPTIAYLKGAKEMYCHGLLATIDVTKLAEAHVSVFKEMNMNAYGRYICFDHIIDTQNEAQNLAKDIGMPKENICGDTLNNSLHSFVMSNEKLCRLMSRSLRCYSEYY
ncbi:putative cinnamoyl-CoA reductase [Lupinus albus]|uniref:Putative cinnamoyl-CoA reductase n=1 Tax=Lupinus albus TaxID=3870 RepID=A0A6A4QFS5_LUPAL|nr:putative cinnamoyl-CoA reductase [Lupinus albus]